MTMPSVTVLTMWYQEAALAPLFLDHYGWADEIVVLLDSDTTDDCGAMAADAGAVVQGVSMPDGMDDARKAELLTYYGRHITATDYVLVADADEFAYAPDGRTIPVVLRSERDLYHVQYWQAYRHLSEGPLDHRGVLVQRRHGDMTPFGQGVGHWRKPSIIRPSCLLSWAPGHHTVTTFGPVSEGVDLAGAHWAMADVDLAIQRRITGRRERMSNANFTAGLTSHNWHITEQEIRNECTRHEDDPQQV